ncbi:major capsid protein [Nitratireductor rhodophyticola]|uniref:major capsid protein n=1 Tax=Nitratireductor rhodophyticola TaxID=2854036 RepID=UPI003BA9445D
MATIGNSYPSLIDAHKGSAEGTVVEILKQQNPILDDAIATECNMQAIHRHMIRTGLPSVSWGRLYKGTPQSKATMQQVDDTTGWLEAGSQIDTRLLKLAPDPAKARLVDSAPFLESMNQEMATGMFYHDTASTPEKFKGLSARYSAYNSNTPDPAKPNAANQVIHGGGSGNDNTSIWFVTWGDHATSLLYPKGSKAGVDIQDKGEQRALDANGNPYYVKETLFEWHLGMFVKDYRYNARIANIDVSDLRAGTVDVWALLRKAYYRLQSRRRDAMSSRIAIYMNREVLEILDAQSTNRALTNARENYTRLGHAEVEGKEVQTYRGIPIRETDALLNTEELVPSVAV